MKTALLFPLKIRKFVLICIVSTYSLLCSIISCNNYQNPGNNTGKTGDGTTRDSLTTSKKDTGKGSNLENKMIDEQNDSALKKRQHKLS